VDIRPCTSRIRGLNFIQDDATQLRTIESNSVESLSTLHAAEHFGLGRYRDPIDPMACFHFMSSLERVLLPGGRLYFSVPIGREKVQFNAQRIFSIETVLASFPRLQLVSFSYVGDEGDLHEDVGPDEVPDSRYACGLFEFTKQEHS
jgi:hypothetical protein